MEESLPFALDILNVDIFIWLSSNNLEPEFQVYRHFQLYFVSVDPRAGHSNSPILIVNVDGRKTRILRRLHPMQKTASSGP